MTGERAEDQRREVNARGRPSAPPANKEVRQLKRLFNLAIQRGHLPAGANPCVGIASIKVGRKRPAYCSPEQFQLIFAQTGDPLWQAMLTVIYSTGIRISEALNLTWNDVDFKTGTLHITRKEAVGKRSR